MDTCMLPAINEISSQKIKPTEASNNKATMLMDYAYIYPNSIFRYYAVDIQLYIDYDVAYLILPHARSRDTGYFYLSNKLTNTSIPPLPKINDPILME